MELGPNHCVHESSHMHTVIGCSTLQCVYAGRSATLQICPAGIHCQYSERTRRGMASHRHPMHNRQYSAPCHYYSGTRHAKKLIQYVGTHRRYSGKQRRLYESAACRRFVIHLGSVQETMRNPASGAVARSGTWVHFLKPNPTRKSWTQPNPTLGNYCPTQSYPSSTLGD